MTRTPTNRIKNWTGTVHYSATVYAGRCAIMKPACGSAGKTAAEWMVPSIATVTCERCIAMFGSDEPGYVDPAPAVDENVARRAAERAARRAAR